MSTARWYIHHWPWYSAAAMLLVSYACFYTTEVGIKHVSDRHSFIVFTFKNIWLLKTLGNTHVILPWQYAVPWILATVNHTEYGQDWRADEFIKYFSQCQNVNINDKLKLIVVRTNRRINEKQRILLDNFEGLYFILYISSYYIFIEKS